MGVGHLLHPYVRAILAILNKCRTQLFKLFLINVELNNFYLHREYGNKSLSKAQILQFYQNHLINLILEDFISESTLNFFNLKKKLPLTHTLVKNFTFSFCLLVFFLLFFQFSFSPSLALFVPDIVPQAPSGYRP